MRSTRGGDGKTAEVDPLQRWPAADDGRPSISGRRGAGAPGMRLKCGDKGRQQERPNSAWHGCAHVESRIRPGARSLAPSHQASSCGTDARPNPRFARPNPARFLRNPHSGRRTPISRPPFQQSDGTPRMHPRPAPPKPPKHARANQSGARSPHCHEACNAWGVNTCCNKGCLCPGPRQANPARLDSGPSQRTPAGWRLVSQWLSKRHVRHISVGTGGGCFLLCSSAGAGSCVNAQSCCHAKKFLLATNHNRGNDKYTLVFFIIDPI